MNVRSEGEQRKMLEVTIGNFEVRDTGMPSLANRFRYLLASPGWIFWGRIRLHNCSGDMDSYPCHFCVTEFLRVRPLRARSKGGRREYVNDKNNYQGIFLHVKVISFLLWIIGILLSSVSLFWKTGNQENVTELWEKKIIKNGTFVCLRPRKWNSVFDFTCITWKIKRFAWHGGQKKLRILFETQGKEIRFSQLFLPFTLWQRIGYTRIKVYLWQGRKINARFDWGCHWYFTWNSNEMPKSRTKIPVLTEQISLCSGSLNSLLYVQVSFFHIWLFLQELMTIIIVFCPCVSYSIQFFICIFLVGRGHEVCSVVSHYC